MQQIFTGNFLVIVLLLVRYRRLRPAVAAFFPSVLVTLLMLGGFAVCGVETNLLHVIGLVMVLGMGVDYGVFVVDSAADPEEMGITMLSTFLGSITTVAHLRRARLLAASGLAGARRDDRDRDPAVLPARAAGAAAAAGSARARACVGGGRRRRVSGFPRAAARVARRWAWDSRAPCRTAGASARARSCPTQQIAGEFLLRQRVRVQGEDLDWRLTLVAQKRGDTLVADRARRLRRRRSSC